MMAVVVPVVIGRLTAGLPCLAGSEEAVRTGPIFFVACDYSWIEGASQRPEQCASRAFQLRARLLLVKGIRLA